MATTEQSSDVIRKLTSSNLLTELNELRMCKGCHEEKPLTEYYKCSKTAWRRKCKKCTCKKINEWKRKNRDLHAGYCNKWREKNKERYQEYINKYRRENYDPEKRHIEHMKYYWGRDVVLTN